MKNKILGGIAVLAIAALATLNVSFNNSKSNISAVSLANIEALAQEMSGYNYVDCRKITEEDPITHNIKETITKECNGFGYGSQKCECP